MDAATSTTGPIRPRSLKLMKVSASQVEAYRSCSRKWFLSWPCGIKQPETRAMRLGTAFHACIENYLNTGVLAPSEEFPEALAMAQAAMPYLPEYEPDESKRKYINEMELRLDTYENGPVWIGYIDCLMEDVGEHEGKPIGKVRDYKSRSDLRYNKTEEELASDTQLGSYAKFGFQVSDYEYLVLEHLNVCTKGASKKVKPVSITVSREWADKIYARDLESVREMEKLQALGLDALQVPATGVANGECDKYGGCAHKTICGMNGGSRFFNNSATTTDKTTNTGTGNDMPELSALEQLLKIKKASDAKTPSAPAGPPPAVAAPIEPAVLSADSPPRTSTRAEIFAANKEPDPEAPTATDEEDTDVVTAEATPAAGEAPKKRGRKPKGEVQEAEAPVAPTPAPTPAAAPVVTVVTDPGPSKNVTFDCKLRLLLIDCVPLRGETFGSLGDIIGQLGDYAAAAYNASNPGKEVADWRLIEYKSAGFMSMAVKMNLHLLPEVLYVDTSLHGSHIVLEDLIRIAKVVVKAFK